MVDLSQPLIMKKSFKCHAAPALMRLNIFPHPNELREMEIPTSISLGTEKDVDTGFLLDVFEYAGGRREVRLSDINFLPQSTGHAIKIQPPKIR